jgi:hypothetical protein
LEEGLTEDQIVLFAHAIEQLSLRDISNQTLAYAPFHSDKEGAKKLQQTLTKKQHTLDKFLIDYERRHG